MLDPATNNWNLGPSADPVPPGLTKPGLWRRIRWIYPRLTDPGHRTRFTFMLHDATRIRLAAMPASLAATLDAGLPHHRQLRLLHLRLQPQLQQRLRNSDNGIVTNRHQRKDGHDTFQNNTTMGHCSGAGHDLAAGYNATSRRSQWAEHIYNTSTGGPLTSQFAAGHDAQRTIARGSSAN